MDPEKEFEVDGDEICPASSCCKDTICSDVPYRYVSGFADVVEPTANSYDTSQRSSWRQTLCWRSPGKPLTFNPTSLLLPPGEARTSDTARSRSEVHTPARAPRPLDLRGDLWWMQVSGTTNCYPQETLYSPRISTGLPSVSADHRMGLSDRSGSPSSQNHLGLALVGNDSLPLRLLNELLNSSCHVFLTDNHYPKRTLNCSCRAFLDQ